MTDRDEPLPWDIKILKLSLGGEADEFGWIRFEIFNDNTFNIYCNDHDPDTGWVAEDLNLEVARRLRDFLNFAVPK